LTFSTEKTFLLIIAPWAARVGRQPAGHKIKTPCQWQVRTSRSASGTSLARLDEGRLKPLTALGLLQRALQMGGICGRTEQMHGCDPHRGSRHKAAAMAAFES